MDLEGVEVEVSQEAMEAVVVEEEGEVEEEEEEEANREPETGSVQTRKSELLTCRGIWIDLFISKVNSFSFKDLNEISHFKTSWYLHTLYS